MQFRMSHLAALTIACVSSTPATAEAQESVQWTSGDVTLSGTLYTPATEGPHPTAIFVPGSGCMPLTHRLIRAHASELPERGFALLVFDKRGCGSSTGDWQVADFDDLADDVLAGLHHLAETNSSVDARRIGLLGLSQGGWVSLVAASKSDSVRFVAKLSGAAMTPAEQGHAAVAQVLAARGHDDAAIAEAGVLDRQIIEVYRSDTGWEEAEEAVSAASGKSWFADAGLGVDSRSSWFWQWYRSIMDYDPIPALCSLPIPILAINGESDLLIPARRSLLAIDSIAAFAEGPRETYLLEGAGHQLRRGRGQPWPPEYWETLAAWLASVAEAE